MANEDIGVSVCHALPDQVWTRVLPAGRRDGGRGHRGQRVRRRFSPQRPWQAGVGVFGRAVRPDTALNDGDRLEIYRGLTFDPKESRRRRAEHRRALTARNGRERPAGLL